MTEDDVAAELRRRGWAQGSLVRAEPTVERTWLELSAGTSIARTGAANGEAARGQWVVRREPLAACEFLVIASQICDILKPPGKEPTVDALAVYATADKAIIKSAQLNSPRYFAIEGRRASGRAAALVADAAHRIVLDKRSLARLDPVTTFTDGSRDTVRRFQNWLADRFGRQALPDELVVVVQRPIVTAIRKLKEADARQRILDKMDYVLCRVIEDGPPMEIELLFLSREAADEPAFTHEEAAQVAGWIAKCIGPTGGEVVNWERFTTTTMSVYDFENAFELPLGEFSLSDEDSSAP